jgi:uncharacterized protein
VDERSSRREFLGRAATATAAAVVAGLADGTAATAAPGERSASGLPPIPERVLGRTGAKVPILGLGADGIVTDWTDEEKVGRFLTDVLDAGVRFFDAAYIYGKDGQCEKNLGLVMGTARRAGAFLATKTGSRTRDGAMRQIETSLKRLRTDHVDLLGVHHVCARDDVKKFGEPDGVLAALRKLRDEKVIRWIGITGHPNDPQVLEALAMYDDWDVLTAFVNPARFSEPSLREQIPLAAKKGMGIVAMKTFGGRPGPLVGTGKGKAPAGELLRFAWSQPVALAIPGATTRKQFEENLAAARGYRPMSGEEIRAIAETINGGPKPWKWEK